MTAENNLILIQISKELTRLYKSFLQDLEHLKSTSKLSQDEYEALRSKTLDNGNESIRQLISFLDFFDFTVNTEKLEKAASQRKIVKRFSSSSLLTEYVE